MTVLLTRNFVDCIDLANKLNISGIDSVIEPMLEIEYLAVPEIYLDKKTAVIFTSQNALRAIDVSSMLDLDCFVVGNSTAALAKQKGFTRILIADSNVRALQDLVLTKRQVQDGGLIYFCGKKITLDIASALSGRGYSIKKICVYEAIPRLDFTAELKTKIIAKQVRLVLLYSYHSAEIFLQLLKNNKMQDLLSGISLLVISEKIGSLVKSCKWHDISVFDIDMSHELFDKIKSYYE